MPAAASSRAARPTRSDLPLGQPDGNGDGQPFGGSGGCSGGSNGDGSSEGRWGTFQKLDQYSKQVHCERERARETRLLLLVQNFELCNALMVLTPSPRQCHVTAPPMPEC